MEEKEKGEEKEKEKERQQVPPVRLISKPAPTTPIGGGGWIAPEPKPTQALTDFPSYYPGDLIPQTAVIIGKAVKKFPVQTQTLQLCKYVISELTPHFCAAVEDGPLRADLALSNMSNLIHYLSVSNCDYESERVRLKQELMKSDEWQNLAEGITASVTIAKAKTPAAPMKSAGVAKKSWVGMKEFWVRNWKWIITTLLQYKKLG